MERREPRVPDQSFAVVQDGCQLIPVPLEFDTEIRGIGHAAHQRTQRGVPALFDDLNGFGRAAGHQAPSTVKAPVAVATGRSSSSSVAVARTKATVRVM